MYIGLVGFKEYFQVIGGFFRAFGFGGFQQADAFVGVVAQQFVGATAVLVGKRFMGSHLQIAAGCLCVAPFDGGGSGVEVGNGACRIYLDTDVYDFVELFRSVLVADGHGVKLA